MLGVNTRLSIMMFLQYAVWGVWAPVLSKFLVGPEAGFDGTEINLVFLTLPLASMAAPFLAGQLADRYFATERVLAFCHLAGAGLLYWAGTAITNFNELFLAMLAYSMLYAPTVALTNSLAMSHLPDPDEQFSRVRSFGTLGWIVIGLAFGFGYIEQNVPLGWAGLDIVPSLGHCLYAAAGLSALTGLYCATLPHTPPAREAADPLAFLKAVRLMSDRSFAVLIVVAFLVSTELQFYYVLTPPFFGDKTAVGLPDGYIGPVMAIGQVMEIVILLFLGYALRRFGFRAVITFGILAWAVRYAVFAFADSRWVVIASQGLHGFGFAFFFVASMVYGERVATSDIRASAQSLIIFVTYGAGMAVSSLIAGPIKDHFTYTVPALGVGVTDWRSVFLVPVGITLGCAVLFFALFRDRVASENLQNSGTAPEPGGDVPVEG